MTTDILRLDDNPFDFNNIPLGVEVISEEEFNKLGRLNSERLEEEISPEVAELLIGILSPIFIDTISTDFNRSDNTFIDLTVLLGAITYEDYVNSLSSAGEGDSSEFSGWVSGFVEELVASNGN